MINFLKHVLLYISTYIDIFVFNNLNIEWKHEYSRKTGYQINDETYSYYSELYDYDKLVIVNTICDDVSNKQQAVQNLNQYFAENVNNYIDNHQYFSLTRYVFERLYPINNFLK